MGWGKIGPKKRVALFGGSFNPPHVGHTAICRWVFEQGIADEVWVIPCFIHPFGKELVDFDHRIEMCRLALSKLHLPVRMLDVERTLGGESWTLRTIEHLRQENPEIRFLLLTGGDVNQQLREWHRFDRIEALVDITHVPRGPDSPIPDVSSTEIRARIAAGGSWRDLVEPDVAEYIISKALYR